MIIYVYIHCDRYCIIEYIIIIYYPIYIYSTYLHTIVVYAILWYMFWCTYYMRVQKKWHVIYYKLPVARAV